jgi:hypothetical protein
MGADFIIRYITLYGQFLTRPTMSKCIDWTRTKVLRFGQTDSDLMNKFEKNSEA